jgi:hypothetical protein
MFIIVRNILFISVVLLCTLSAPALAQKKEDRLLPEAFAKTIEITFQQDGRAVDIFVTNPKDKWVVTAISVTIVYKPIAHIPHSAYSDFQQDPDYRSWPLHVLPGKMERIYLELGGGEALASVVLVEARGRESNFLDEAQEWLFK